MDYSFEPHVRFVSKTNYLIENKYIAARDARLLYVISGSAEFESDGKILPLHQNSLLYYPSSKAYRFINNSSLMFYTLNFDFTKEFSDVTKTQPQPISEYKADSELDTRAAVSEPLFSSALLIENAIWAEADIERIYEENLRQSFGFKEMQSISLKKLLIGIYRKENERQTHPLCERVKALVRDNKSIKNKEIAKSLGYHPIYVNEVFKKEVGISLHRYVIKERLILAYEMLTTTRTSLDEISAECGFSSSQHFSAAFSALYGIPPGKLRRHF